MEQLVGLRKASTQPTSLCINLSEQLSKDPNHRILLFGILWLWVSIVVWRKYIIAPVSLSMVLSLSSCSDSKVAQCERLIKQVNEGTVLIDKNKGAQVSTSLKLAKELEDVTNKIRDLNLGDEKLKEYQSKFVKIFETLSKNVGTAGKALGSAKNAEASNAGRVTIQKARGNIDTALKNATDAAAQFDSSVSELNKYCTKPES